MNAISLLGNIPVAVWIGLVSSVAIPFLSALETRAPSFMTGAITLILSGLTGVLTTLADSGDLTWRAAGVALLSWLIATKTHTKILAGTATEARLHAVGSKQSTQPGAL